VRKGGRRSESATDFGAVVGDELFESQPSIDPPFSDWPKGRRPMNTSSLVRGSSSSDRNTSFR